nr:BAG domain-containing protein Samui isoform X2 [Drosophila suzukii]
MKPTVMAANQAPSNPTNGGNGSTAGPGVNIPVNREYVSGGYGSPQQQAGQSPHFHNPPQNAYGSPRQQQQHFQQHPQQVPPNQQQQHFQPTFGFEPNMDMDNMFPRSHLGRMHDPFAGFGDSHFGFPRFSAMGRRGRMPGAANNHMDHDDDFFNRLPSEFRQYIPDGFGARRGPGVPTAPGPVPQQQPQAPPQQHPQQHYQYAVPPQQQQVYVGPPQQQVPQSPSKRLCDAAIQTEDPAGRSEVDCAPPANLNQHGLRNTVDMGVKSAAEQDQGLRSHSAPPPEQQQQNLLYQQQQQPQQPGAHHQQFGTQTSPPVQGQQFKSYYAPQQQTHPQQKQPTPPPAPQTPGGTYVRTIPIFVEGRTEPIINAHKEIPNQNAPPSAQAQAQAQANFAPPQQQRPTPLNTQQAQAHADQEVPAEGAAGLPPQTPHTLNSINKIQDIQRDVLELMGKVEQFKGTRQEKEYAYLDEMLTRNLLKLDTIDTNGKDSIRLARKEAIKCIQASINVLEAKAEENARLASGGAAASAAPVESVDTAAVAAPEAAGQIAEPTTPQPQDATKIQEPIPLPPPPNAAPVEGSAAPEASVVEPLDAGETTAQSETTTTTSE